MHLKLLKKLNKKIKTDPGLILTKEMYSWPSTYMQEMSEIPAIVTENIVLRTCTEIFTLLVGEHPL